MSKYHIGKNGPAVCKANKRACKYENTSGHFGSLDEAKVTAENMEKEINGGVTVSAPFKKRVDKEPVMEIDKESTKSWMVNGVLHRKDGPAVIYFDGSKEWWVNGELVKSTANKIYDNGQLKEVKYHIGKNGPDVCKADQRTCRYQENGHFDSWKAAQLANEKIKGERV